MTKWINLKQSCQVKETTQKGVLTLCFYLCKIVENTVCTDRKQVSGSLEMASGGEGMRSGLHCGTKIGGVG